MRSLLVAVDLSPRSMSLLRYAFAFAEQADMRVDTVHVYRAPLPPTSHGLAAGDGPDLARDRTFDAQHREVLRVLDALLEQFAGSRARGRAIAACGPIAAVVAETARQLGSALIMLSRRTHAWSGSSLEDIARSVILAADRPVLIVKPESRQASVPAHNA